MDSFALIPQHINSSISFVTQDGQITAVGFTSFSLVCSVSEIVNFTEIFILPEGFGPTTKQVSNLIPIFRNPQHLLLSSDRGVFIAQTEPLKTKREP